MDTCAALALGTEMPTEALLDRKPYSPKASIISPVMIRNIIGQSVLQITILCIILFSGAQIWGVADRGADRVHLTIFFNTFVFLQIFNELNSRKVNGEWNIFEKFFDNWIFTYVLLASLGMQLLMVEVFGSFASTVRHACQSDARVLFQSDSVALSYGHFTCHDQALELALSSFCFYFFFFFHLFLFRIAHLSILELRRT